MLRSINRSFKRFVEGSQSIRVNPVDGVCRRCGGELTIIDADDATITVECENEVCGDSYAVEPDAFGDGRMTYYVGFLTGQAVNEE